MSEYFTTRSKTLAYALQYVSEQNFYKFSTDDNQTIYSFKKSPMLLRKIKELNNIKFNIK